MILTKSINKKINIVDEIEKKIKNGETSRLLLIVPTNRRARYLKKEIISSSPNKTTTSINLETISTFASKIVLNDSDTRRDGLSEPASYILLEQAFDEIKPQYFSNYKNSIPTGTLQQIKNVISEYKKHGITPKILRDELDKLTGSEKLKATNIADIYEVYQHKIEEIGIKEIGDIYKDFCGLSLDNFQKRFSEFFCDVNLIAAIGFDEFTLLEIKIMEIFSNYKGADFFVHIDFQPGNSSIFNHLNKTYQKFIEKGFHIIEEKVGVKTNKFEQYVRNNLFEPKDKIVNSEFDDKIYLIAAIDKVNEIEIISKEIKDLITNYNVQPSDICIAFNSIQKYSPFIRDVFSTYGIPFNLTDRFTLNSSMPVTSIINILEIIENDFYYKDILRVSTSSFLNQLDINGHSILKAATKLKIIAGLGNWLNILEDEINIRKNNSSIEWEDKLKIETFEEALSGIRKIQKLLNPFSKKMNIAEFKDNTLELIFSLKIPVKLSDDKIFNSEKNIKSITIFIELLEEFSTLLKSQHGATKKFPIKFFLKYLRTAVMFTRYNIKEKPSFGVQVTSINEIRGLKFDYLFLSGLCDRIFPTRYQPEIFFTGTYFKKENQHQAKERYQFYQALCGWKKKLYLTYPQTDERSELVKSNFITELESIIKLTNIDIDKYTNKVFSKNEYLIELGKRDGDSEIEEEVPSINLNEIEKSINIDKLRREEPFANSSFTGVIGDEINAGAKEKLFSFKERQYSSSQLETYAKCPYKYFAERVLKIEPNEEPTEEMEFHELGTLLHTILYEFYTQLKRKGIILSGCSNTEFNDAKKIIFKLAEAKISGSFFSSPLTFFEKERILGIDGKQENSILFKFLLNERENKDGFVPTLFETGFGKFGNESEEKDHLFENVKIDDIKIRGKIDRVDLDEVGNKYKIVDYKLFGKKPSLNKIKDGISLQIPLYLYAAKEIIKAQFNKDSEPAGGEIYSLKYKNEEFGKKIVKPFNKRKFDEEELLEGYEKIIKGSVEFVKRYVQQITKGKFNLSMLSNRETEICKYCGFKSVCRIQEIS